MKKDSLYQFLNFQPVVYKLNCTIITAHSDKGTLWLTKATSSNELNTQLYRALPRAVVILILHQYQIQNTLQNRKESHVMHFTLTTVLIYNTFDIIVNINQLASEEQ